MERIVLTDQKKEDVRQAADIVDVVSDYVKLKKSGSNFTGLCPFHNEKTPSFNVTPRLGIYKCFGCDAGGDVFNFIMEMEGVNFIEAVKTLADRYNISLPTKEADDRFTEQNRLIEGIYHALSFAGVFYHRTLAEDDDAKEARHYFKNRGLNTETLKKYGLGYAPGGFDTFYKHATENGINEEYLVEAGLIKYSDRDQRPFDVFRERIMFPIFNPAGKVIAFGGRTMEKGKNPKYINSPQTKVYNKSEAMYGIHLARHDIRRKDGVILVEGYMDVISLYQHGIKNAVATSGTSITTQQMQLISRYSKNLLMVYDADQAGQNAMIRGLETALTQGLNVRLMHLPEGEDPDSFVKQFGAESFHSYVQDESRDFISFLIESAEKSGAWNDPMSRKEEISRVLGFIASVDDEIMRQTLVGHLSKLSGIGDRALFNELDVRLMEKKEEKQRDLERARRQREREQAPDVSAGQRPAGEPQLSGVKRQPVSRPKKRPAYEQELIRLMLAYEDDMVYYVGNNAHEEEFEDEDLRRFYQDLKKRYQHEEKISPEVYTRMDHPFPQIVSEVLIEKHTVSERGNELRELIIRKDADPYATARGALKTLKIAFFKRNLEEISNRISEGGISDEERREAYSDLMETRKQLSEIEKTPADYLFPGIDEIESEEEETG